MKSFSRSSTDFLQAKSQYFQVRFPKQCTKMKQEENCKTSSVPCCQIPTVIGDVLLGKLSKSQPEESQSFKETIALNAFLIKA